MNGSIDEYALDELTYQHMNDEIVLDEIVELCDALGPYIETESSILQFVFNNGKFENMLTEYIENFHYRTINSFKRKHPEFLYRRGVRKDML